MRRSILKVLKIKELITCLHLIVIQLDFNNTYLSLIQSSDKPSNLIFKENGLKQEKMLRDVSSCGTLMDQQKRYKDICNFTNFSSQANGTDVVMQMKFLILKKLIRNLIFKSMIMKITRMNQKKKRKNKYKTTKNLRKVILKKVNLRKVAKLKKEVNQKIENKPKYYRIIFL